MEELKKQRPSKKQAELLGFVKTFIAEKGYGPSYREIMSGCNYSSVATVAVHVNNLIARGHLAKKSKSARSLEVVDDNQADNNKIQTNNISPSEEKWLVEHISYRFSQAESGQATQVEIDGLYVLVGALKVLGFDGASQSFIPRLAKLKQQIK